MSKTLFQHILLIVSCQLSLAVNAQEIPVGTWRAHTSFNSIHTISVGTSKVYAGSDNGVLVFDLADNSLATITKLDGLSSTNITQVVLDQTRQQVLVSYADGDLDILKQNEIINFDRLKNSTTVAGSKRINHISMRENLAYLATDYGLVVFDLNQLEVKETWRDLGSAGTKIKIYQSTFRDDSIFLATEQGVLAGDLDDNLLDFNNWRRFNTGMFNGNIQSITIFDGKVYAAINGSGIYRYENGSWTLQNYLQSLSFKNITSSANNMLITEGTNLHAVNTSGISSTITSGKIVNPFIGFEDVSGKRWVGDQRNGLVSDKSGGFESYVPNGPSFSPGLRVNYDPASNRMLAVSGGYSASFTALQKTEFLNSFSSGSWTQATTFLNKDLTDVEIVGSKMFLSSYGQGIQVIENESIIFQDASTCPFITDLAVSAAGVWATNFGVTQSLRLLKNDNSWESFSFAGVPASLYPTDLAVDYLGNVWMVLNPANGGGIIVFDKEANDFAYLTEVPGSGGLPSKSVYSIAIDRNGIVWVGTASGVAYFPDPSRVFDPGINAVKPIFDERFLLRNEKVTAIEVDGGNRKWMGTENGVWLFNSFGEEQGYYFTAANSPLLSDEIIDIEVHGKSGEVFFVTTVGICSFRSDATTSDGVFQQVKIFPNPVTSQFNGFVGISGLATDAFVKITDVSGKLIWQTQANGGTAAWDVRDYNGRRAATGMYLVLSTSVDGTESVVGKIAVVD
ncbi:MAG TPA: two-component regulator propeller domain-containing protein [Cyclobacteriaceae bacterium]